VRRIVEVNKCVTWDGRDNDTHYVASGVYLIELRSGSQKGVVKTSLVR